MVSSYLILLTGQSAWAQAAACMLTHTLHELASLPECYALRSTGGWLTLTRLASKVYSVAIEDSGPDCDQSLLRKDEARQNIDTAPGHNY